MQTTLTLFSYGGLCESTLDAVLRELSMNSLKFQRISGDALISRSRSRALGRWYTHEQTGPDDVMVMVDHDMEWRPGDLLHIAKEASDKKALVGGLYCKRTFGKGWSSAVNATGEVEFGKPGLIPTDRLATGFLAIPHSAVKTLLDEWLFEGPKFQEKLSKAAGNPDLLFKLCNLALNPIADGAWKKVEHRYWDFFRCYSQPNSSKNGQYQFLSEDWAFSMRCEEAGIQSYLSTFPLLTHWGDYGYKVPDGMDAELKHAQAENTKRRKRQNKGAGRAQK